MSDNKNNNLILSTRILDSLILSSMILYSEDGYKLS